MSEQVGQIEVVEEIRAAIERGDIEGACHEPFNTRVVEQGENYLTYQVARGRGDDVARISVIWGEDSSGVPMRGEVLAVEVEVVDGWGKWIESTAQEAARRMQPSNTWRAWVGEAGRPDWEGEADSEEEAREAAYTYASHPDRRGPDLEAWQLIVERV